MYLANTKNKLILIARLIIIKSSSALLYLISHKWVQCWFSGQNSQLAGQILFCPDVSAGHFQKLFQVLLYVFPLFTFKSSYSNVFQVELYKTLFSHFLTYLMLHRPIMMVFIMSFRY